MDTNERINPSDDVVHEGFDQTNDLAGDQLGESDETLDGSVSSAAERGGDNDSLLGGDNDDDGLVAGSDAEDGTNRAGGDFLPPGNTLRGGAGGM